MKKIPYKSSGFTIITPEGFEIILTYHWHKNNIGEGRNNEMLSVSARIRTRPHGESNPGYKIENLAS